MAKKVTPTEAPSLVSRPNVVFDVDEQNAMVYNKGIDVTIEKAVKCPCRTKDNSYRAECKNCLGVGWVFVNAISDRAMMTSLNASTKYKDWSEELIGTVSVTTSRQNNLAYMDKITIDDSIVSYSETIYPKFFDNKLFAYTIHNIIGVEILFEFVDVDVKLVNLVHSTDFTFERNKIILTTTNTSDVTSLKALTHTEKEKALMTTTEELYRYDETSEETPDDDLVIKPDDITLPTAGRWLKVENYTITVKYTHKLQYYVLDQPHVIRNSYRKDNQGRDELQNLPTQVVARLVHYVIDSLNFVGDNIFDNSTVE